MRKFSRLLLLLALGGSSGYGVLNYEVYLESWDTNYATAYQTLPTVGGPEQYSNMTLNISFAAYNFASAKAHGTQFNGNASTDQTAAIQAIVNYVHTAGGKVQLAFGGASSAPPYGSSNPALNQYYLAGTSTQSPPYWPGSTLTGNAATAIAGLVSSLNLDGIDFDFEEPVPSGYTAETFAAALVTFLEQVRALLPNTTLTLTIPAQGWGTYFKPLAQGAAPIVNAINFMEYNIWINPALPGATPTDKYVAQVKADIVTYTSPISGPNQPPNNSPGWGIPISKIQIGVMTGLNDSQQLMTPAGAVELAQYAKVVGVEGVFLWDINRDAGTVPSPPASAAYSYSNGIRDELNNLSVEEYDPDLEAIDPTNYALTRRRKSREINNSPIFVPVPPPPHGAP